MQRITVKKADMPANGCCLALMSKAPIPGEVKTRLMPTLSSRQASSVYQALLANTIKNVSTVHGTDLHIWCSPDTKHPVFRRLSSIYQARLRQQPPGNLGQRMSRIASNSLREYRQVIILGSDCPVIDAQEIEQCKQHLDNDADIVLGATEDGGYVFVGLRRHVPAIFQFVPWSTSRVLVVTIKQARRLGMQVVVMRGFWDVDTPEDYRRWRQLKKSTVLYNAGP